MSWFFFNFDEFSNKDCLPSMWWISCTTNSWRHVDSQIKSMLPQIIKILYDLLTTSEPPIGVHIGRMVRGWGRGVHKIPTKIFHMFERVYDYFLKLVALNVIFMLYILLEIICIIWGPTCLNLYVFLMYNSIANKLTIDLWNCNWNLLIYDKGLRIMLWWWSFW